MASLLANGFSFTALTAALVGCATPSSVQAPRPVTPDHGPNGTVMVDVFGRGFARQIQPRFRLDRSGYVLVGHLGGDGQIRVLYPETPRKSGWVSSGWVSGGKLIQLKPHAAVWDASPNLYSYATAPYRNFSAQMDSYDGRGHGFVFMITSRYPIDYEAIMGASGYEELAVEDYEDSSDPRYAVRALADDLTTGPYTLKFARNARGNMYAESTGCPTHWGLWSYGSSFEPFLYEGYSFLFFPGASMLRGLAIARYHGLQSCRGSHYAFGRLFLPTVVTTTVTQVPPTPTGPITPRLQRPTRRTLEEGQRTRILTGRSPIDRTIDRTGETLSHRRPTTGDGFGRVGSRERTIERTDRGREVERSRPTSTEIHRGRENASRPPETPRMTTPAAPPQTTTTTTSTGGETKAERPRPQP